MPEVNKDATILVATSWQALCRARNSTGETQLCDCTVVILFAGFFLEANLNEIIERLGLYNQMKKFLCPKKSKYEPGLQPKLAWFYNEFVARQKASNQDQMYKNGIKRKIGRKFPGFAELHRFRNDISHGVINKTARSLQKTEGLRQQAKEIVDSLFEITERAGHDIPRDTTYWDAIKAYPLI